MLALRGVSSICHAYGDCNHVSPPCQRRAIIAYMLQILAAIKILRRSNAACCGCGWDGLPGPSSLALILAAVISRNTVGPVDGRLEEERSPRH
jgi:hypothetical protein